MDPQKQLEHINDLLTKIKEYLMVVEQQIEATRRIQNNPAGLYAGTMESATAHALPLYLASPAMPMEEDK